LASPFGCPSWRSLLPPSQGWRWKVLARPFATFTSFHPNALMKIFPSFAHVPSSFFGTSQLSCSFVLFLFVLSGISFLSLFAVLIPFFLVGHLFSCFPFPCALNLHSPQGPVAFQMTPHSSTPDLTLARLPVFRVFFFPRVCFLAQVPCGFPPLVAGSQLFAPYFFGSQFVFGFCFFFSPPGPFVPDCTVCVLLVVLVFHPHM